MVADPVPNAFDESESVHDDLPLEDEGLLEAPAESATSLVYAYTVGAGQGDRLDKFLMSALPEAIVSREKLKVAIREGQCHIDGAVCTEPKAKVISGQTVSVYFVQEETSIVPRDLGLECIYKDAALVVVNKPHGLTVHPCPSCDEVTLVQGVAHDFPQLAAMPGVRPGIVHRLDKETSGLMVVALREDVRLRLSDAFAERSVHKTYLAIVCGIPAKAGVCKEPIGRHPTQRVKMTVARSGKTAHTEWERLYADPQGLFSLLAVTIHTGRTHQIRVHMTHLGHPLVGDVLYTVPKWKAVQSRAGRQMLHAWKLSFAHPEAGEALHFVLPMPEDMRRTLLQLGRTTQRVVITGCPGCGKSTVLAQLQTQGMDVLSADAVVSALYAEGQAGQKAVARYLGSQFIDPVTGDVNRRALFSAMQTDDAVRERLNWLIHPLVHERIRQFWEDAEARGQRFAVAEIPLWAETRQAFAGEEPPYIVAVSCRTAIRHERLMSNRSWSKDMCEHMDSWQLPESQKFTRAHMVIDNSASLENLLVQMERLAQKLDAVYAERNKVLLTVLQSLC